MAGTYDSENQRIIDRIKCIAFREASDAGATLITRKWIANELHRTEDWVRRHWNNSPEECFTEFHGGRPLQLSRESREMISFSES